MVEEKDIQSVVNGFNEYLRQAQELQSFNVIGLKNFMEPIFTQAGYRDPVINGGGANVSNVLILHEAAAGDFVVMTNLVREVRHLYPTAHITLVIDVRAEHLAERCPYVNEIIVGLFRINGRSMQSHTYELKYLIPMMNVNLEIAEKLLARRYDIAFATVHSTSPTTPLLAYMSGAKCHIASVGSKNIWFPLVNLKPGKPYGRHHSDIALSYVECLTKKRVTDRRLEAWFDQNDLDVVKALMPQSKKIYAIGIGSNYPKNHYPPGSYAELTRLIAQEDDDVKFIVVGGKKELDEANVLLANAAPNRVVSLVDKISYRQTAAAISLCNLYIGNDTGATHLAAASGIPVINANPFPFDVNRTIKLFHRWAPYWVPAVVVCPAHALPGCRGSKDFRGCRANKPHCITQITPQNLFDAYKVLLDQIDKGNKHYVLFNPEKGVVK